MNLVLGTMTIGQQVLLNEATEMVEYFISKGYYELDTAYVYNDGECEKTLGNVFTELKNNQLKIATKANPRITGRLDGEAVRNQLNESLTRMGVEKVDIFYLHFPDPNTPVEDALRVCNDLYLEGKFNELGLSNFPAWMVVEAYYKCLMNGWVLPTVYQGVYNPLTRSSEAELFDALRALNMRFYAYNPLAGGILSGKYDPQKNMPESGRFALRKSYPDRYWKQSVFNAVETIRKACDNLSMVEVVFRWLAYHSRLEADKGDSLIIGASSTNQLKENLDAFNKGPLPIEIVEVFEEAWEKCKGDSKEYFTIFKGEKQ